MKLRLTLVLAVISGIGYGLHSAELPLPARPAKAPKGTAFAAQLRDLEPVAREAAIVAEVKRGNVPAFWRKFVAVRSGDAEFFVAPDYLCVGADDDYFLTPLTPVAAQEVADHLGCVLPTPKMVEAIYRAATVKLNPTPIPPSSAMTSVAVFAQHNEMIAEQRRPLLAEHPLGELVTGHKKDVVISTRLARSPGKVAIYGWHKPDGMPIQPLYLGHAATWADYSHGIRLVSRRITWNGEPTTIDAVLADPNRCAALSDEGPMAVPRYAAMSNGPSAAEEKQEDLRFEPGVRVVINTPATIDRDKPTRLVLYALPAGNTIEQTIGRRPKEGDDWHFNIQHIGAQTRWLRARVPEENLVVAYVQADERSWVLWRRAHPDYPQRIVEIVRAIRSRYPSAKLVLASHSAGGSFVFGYLDGVEEIENDIERIAFLDSDYAYDSTKAHDRKLQQWLAGSEARRLCVVAYEDYVALLNGKTFVSEQGGTWGRSQAMLRDLGQTLTFTRQDDAGLQRHRALGGRVEFLLKENPTKEVWHTRQVELNGFIQAMLSGTEREGRGYSYLGSRAYEGWISPE